METLLIILGALFLVGLVIGLIKIVFNLVVELVKIIMILAAISGAGYLIYLVL